MGETWNIPKFNDTHHHRIDAELADVLLSYIGQFAVLTPAEIDGILQQVQVKLFPKGDVLLREGQFANWCHFVLKGCVRQYYLVDGVEKTIHFYTEGEPITASEGTYSRQPSKYYLACIEDCILSVSTPEEANAMNSRSPQYETVCRIAAEDELANSHEKFASFIIHSPEERYLHLLQTRPDLIDRVPQYYLASYLGVAPESLSRIRKRIMSRKHSM